MPFTKTTISLAVMVLFIAASSFAQVTALNEHSVKFSGTASATLVGQDGLILKTTNNGIDWLELTSNITNTLFGNAEKSGISFAAGENGVVLRSTDSGLNWDVQLPGTFENLNDIELIDANKVVTCGNNGVIYFSTDCGATWTATNSGTTRSLNDIKFLATGVGYITGELGTLLKSTDAGATWQAINMNFTNNKFNAVEAIDEYSLVLVGDNGSIFLSVDGGFSWFAPTGNLYTSNLNDVVFFDADNGIIAGNDGLILKTDDGGYSWYAANTTFSGDGYDFYAVAFADAFNGIATGVNGTEVYSVDGGMNWTETPPGFSNQTPGSQRSVKNEVSLNQNYPNPFNPSTKISFDMPAGGNVTLKVFDITGKEIALLASGYYNSGSHSVSFNASALSSGVYFYKLNVTGGNTESFKVMKMILTK